MWFALLGLAGWLACSVVSLYLLGQGYKKNHQVMTPLFWFMYLLMSLCFGPFAMVISLIMYVEPAEGMDTSQKGFTLLELLAVLCILAVIFLLVMPTLCRQGWVPESWMSYCYQR